MASVVLDGEAVAGDGHAGIQAVFEVRSRADGGVPSRPSTCWIVTATASSKRRGSIDQRVEEVSCLSRAL